MEDFPARFIRELKDHLLFVCIINDSPVKMYVEKETGRKKLNARGLAKALGYKDVQEMLGDDDILELMNEVKKETGKFPYHFTENESDL